jgi:hypothetical protein
MNPGQGWNYWWGEPYQYEEYQHPTAWTGRMTKEYIESYDFEKPLFLKSSFHRPHSPYDPPQRLIDQVDPDLMQDVVYGNDWDNKFKNAS